MKLLQNVLNILKILLSISLGVGSLRQLIGNNVLDTHQPAEGILTLLVAILYLLYAGYLLYSGLNSILNARLQNGLFVWIGNLLNLLFAIGLTIIHVRLPLEQTNQLWIGSMVILILLVSIHDIKRLTLQLRTPHGSTRY